jgi:hypothetical protein
VAMSEIWPRGSGEDGPGLWQASRLFGDEYENQQGEQLCRAASARVYERTPAQLGETIATGELGHDTAQRRADRTSKPILS